MVLGLRRGLGWWLNRRGVGPATRVTVALVLALGSAWVTGQLGLHPVFGGLLAGLTYPRQGSAPDADVLRPMEQIGGVLLPLFFIVTGLSTDIGALNGDALALLGIACASAIAGKMAPAYAASRLGGLDRKDGASVAVLVSTRGLTELIALNVGLTAGIINPALFSVLVLMALITTVITSPLLSLVRPRPDVPEVAPEPVRADGHRN